VILHQWLGILIGVGALVHLFNHWEWVKAIGKKFFMACANRSRLYFILDAALMVGLAMIIITGVVISTWFGLSGSTYQVWHRFHILNSMVTLALMIIKLLYHWKVIANAFRRVFTTQPVCSQPQNAESAAATQPASFISRRDALRVMGAVSFAGAIAMTKAGLGLNFSSAGNVAALPSSDQLPQPQVTTVSTQPAASVPASASSLQPTPTALPAPTQQAPAACVYRCPRGNHCDYPGRCRLYTDNNNNGLCDLGECL